MNYSNFSVGKVVAAVTGLTIVAFIFALPDSITADQVQVQPKLIETEYSELQATAKPVKTVTRTVKSAPAKAPPKSKRRYAKRTTQENMTQQQVILIKQTKTLDSLQKRTRQALKQLKAERKKLKAQRKALRQSTKKRSSAKSSR